MYVTVGEDSRVEEVYNEFEQEGFNLTQNMLTNAPTQVNSASYSHVNNGLGVAAAPAAPTIACVDNDGLIGQMVTTSSVTSGGTSQLHQANDYVAEYGAASLTTSVTSGGTSQLRQANDNVAAYGAASLTTSVTSGGTSQLRQANDNVAAYGSNQHPQQPRNLSVRPTTTTIPIRPRRFSPPPRSSASSMHSTPAARPRPNAHQVQRPGTHHHASSGSVHTTPQPALRRSARRRKAPNHANDFIR
jgi:hypothetical protein